ncbi:cupin domain-containing protein [Campylobacter sp. faydin G-24]|uniref:Cupin domain-containing protein n=1 Tax=Campylobacter anatolicus TaxID=2829105 RepID=A0ABS5HIW7_9BACT|nr:cupin domain-containing protein [Campylobacter anatolicus]MBR8461423.1 cupin domain-containing protein [Campylobacter anatolicus]MBR8464214.1 cupin domain-containing protein [Campylobacter anatolicus]MBR8466119.1 cupin domain-containing protein [Campylobacter anatolicus]
MKQEGQMLIKKAEQEEFVGRSEFFTGNVIIKKIFDSTQYANFGASLVHFKKGARTVWHTHPAGQRFIVTKGVIYTGTKDGILQVAHEGDAVLCPPDVEHFHGAGFKDIGEHIALTLEKDGKNVTWLESISDEEYAKFIAKADKQDVKK